jgi:membrane-bound metal-dependent hydrolase YbcI (DUF457 family)
MPSPIAHSALILLAQPLLPRRALAALSRPQRVLLLAATLFALSAPDSDFLLSALFPNLLPGGHGTRLHSFLFAIPFAFLFASALRLFLKIPYRNLYFLGLTCYLSHILLDILTRGRGAMALWPFIDQRIASPYPLFFGLHWSQPLAWKLHLITIANEAVFAALIYLIARRVHRKSRLTSRASAQPATQA